MTENEFLLSDRITKIKSMNDMYDLEHNAYISFSGGKDSTVLSYLIDEALPNNKIPRVYVNTGLDYKLIREFVFDKIKNDKRFVAITHGKNILEILRKDGYPFKSKIHATLVDYRQKGMETDYLNFYFKKIENYNGKATNRCPSKLLYQYDFNDFRISANCCIVMKEKPLQNWQKENNKSIYISGMRNSEGGRRANKSGCIVMKGNKVKSFNPLFIVNDDFMEFYIKLRNIKLAKLYYPPYNFVRTGCKGCPFDLKLQDELNILQKFFPNERKQCEMIWKPVYDEYRRIGYRLEKEDEFKLFNI